MNAEPLFPGFIARRVQTDGADIHCVVGGAGPPVLLLHGYPQTHAMWHRVAVPLARHYTVVCPDLRGYGDSSKPPAVTDHEQQSKRAMAQDMLELMRALGYARFRLAGHDRGGRVAHRLVVDHPEAVERVVVLDISPTRKMYACTDKEFATRYYHWFFLIQPYDLPERLIGHDPVYYLRRKIGSWGGGLSYFDSRALAEYERCFSNPATIHASCEDYRAAASIDLVHDDEDIAEGRRVDRPLLVLWGERGVIQRLFRPLDDWREVASAVHGRAIAASHFLAEEAPEATMSEMLAFFAG